MTAEVISGSAISKQIREELKQEVKLLKEKYNRYIIRKPAIG